MFNFYMDAHMHFDLYDDRNEILRYVEQKKSYTIAVTNLPQLFEKYKHQYVENKYFQLALGFHPELVHQYSNQQMLFKELINETRFIGEIGLDFAKKSKEDVTSQTEVFEKILEWCSGKNKILTIHSRSASNRVVDMLDGFDGSVILHWYSGGITDLRRAIVQGCYFSINHQMLQSINGRNIVRNIPVDRLLVESDAPFTKGLSEKYTINFNDVIYKYIGDLYHQEIDIVKKRVKANFAEILKTSNV
ncbi:MAG: TatD family hydrolase [Clostridium sp.]|nr:TatD family hydrolase [Clostridium sp.]